MPDNTPQYGHGAVEGVASLPRNGAPGPGGAPTAHQTTAMQKSPADLAAWIFSQLGWAPTNRNSPYSGLVRDRMTKVLPALMMAEGLVDDNVAGKFADTYGPRALEWARLMGQQGGNFFQTAGGLAESALGRLPGAKGADGLNLGFDETNALLQQMTALRTMGMDPFSGMSAENDLEDAVEGFRTVAINDPNAGADMDLSLAQYIRNNHARILGGAR